MGSPLNKAAVIALVAVALLLVPAHARVDLTTSMQRTQTSSRVTLAAKLTAKGVSCASACPYQGGSCCEGADACCPPSSTCLKSSPGKPQMCAPITGTTAAVSIDQKSAGKGENRVHVLLGTPAPVINSGATTYVNQGEADEQDDGGMSPQQSFPYAGMPGQGFPASGMIVPGPNGFTFVPTSYGQMSPYGPGAGGFGPYAGNPMMNPMMQACMMNPMMCMMNGGMMGGGMQQNADAAKDTKPGSKDSKSGDAASADANRDVIARILDQANYLQTEATKKVNLAAKKAVHRVQRAILIGNRLNAAGKNLENFVTSKFNPDDEALPASVSSGVPGSGD